jgi:hypothetical protein
MALVSKTFSEIITFTRATTGTFVDSAGVLQTAAIDAPRFDYNPTTLAPLGFLVEEARTNSISNNTMVGAAAGTPGTLPTNWGTFTNITGLTQTVVGTGTESGITYIDVRLFGVVTAGTIYRFFSEPANGVAALTGQTWTSSQYLRVVAGSTAGISLVSNLYQEFTSASVFVTEAAVNVTVPTSAALITQKSSTTRTLAGGATTAFLRPAIQLTVTSTAIDITLRIGLPQLELGAFATSVIPTTTAAVTRAADVASINTLSPWFNAVEGTLFSQTLLTRQNAVGGTNVFYIWDTVTSELKIFYRGSGAVGAASIVSGVLQADLSPSAAIPANTVAKVAFGVKTNDFAASANGGAVVTDTSGTVPTGLTQVILGGPGSINGYLQRITYYPRRLTDAELQTLTA